MSITNNSQEMFSRHWRFRLHPLGPTPTCQMANPAIESFARNVRIAISNRPVGRDYEYSTTHVDQRSLQGWCVPLGSKKRDTEEQLSFTSLWDNRGTV